MHPELDRVGPEDHKHLVDVYHQLNLIYFIQALLYTHRSSITTTE